MRIRGEDLCSLKLVTCVPKGILDERCASIWSLWKVSSRYVGPYKVLERCGTVAYRLQLQNILLAVHNIFMFPN